MTLQSRFKKPEQPNVERRLLSPAQAAKYLNFGVKIVYRMVNQRLIPHVRNGNRFLIDRVDLDRLIERRKIRAVPAWYD